MVYRYFIGKSSLDISARLFHFRLKYLKCTSLQFTIFTANAPHHFMQMNTIFIISICVFFFRILWSLLNCIFYCNCLLFFIIFFIFQLFSQPLDIQLSKNCKSYSVKSLFPSIFIIKIKYSFIISNKKFSFDDRQYVYYFWGSLISQ